jgi:hypothetical protein
MKQTILAFLYITIFFTSAFARLPLRFKSSKFKIVRAIGYTYDEALKDYKKSPRVSYYHHSILDIRDGEIEFSGEELNMTLEVRFTELKDEFFVYDCGVKQWTRIAFNTKEPYAIMYWNYDSKKDMYLNFTELALEAI